MISCMMMRQKRISLFSMMIRRPHRLRTISLQKTMLSTLTIAHHNNTSSSSSSTCMTAATRKRFVGNNNKDGMQPRCITTTAANCAFVTNDNTESSAMNHDCSLRFRAPNKRDVEIFLSILQEEDDSDNNNSSNRGSVIFQQQDDTDDDDPVVAHVIDELEVRNTDWTHHYRGKSSLILKPRTGQQISRILQYCQQQHIPIVPQGGKTGLVGGSVPVSNQEIILSMERLNNIIHFNEHSGILQCQAGCILQDLQTYCHHRHHLVPIDLGSKGTCQIGGNLGTNAGGPYFARYGSLAANVLGIQVVLADGRILDLNYSTPNLKNNTGYKLHQIFLGAEGTLGIITAVALLCPRYPTSRQAVFVACTNYQQVLQVLNHAKTQLSEILAALEWMDQSIIALVGKQVSIPVVVSSSSSNDRGDKDNDDAYCYYPYYLLVETHGSSLEHDQAKMERFLETCMEQGYIADGVLAQDLKQVEHFWKIRELTNPAAMATGYGYKYDLSLPVAEFADFIQQMQDQCRTNLPDKYVTKKLWNGNWGHIMDGNIHFNMTTPGCFERDEKVLEVLEPFIFKAVLARGGSISAEHGLGQQKNECLHMVYSNTGNELQVMQSLKDLFDPSGILNPYKYLPSRNKSNHNALHTN